MPSERVCWVCRANDATTREHRLKQTDLLDLAPVSETSPLIFNDPRRRNAHVKGRKSRFLMPDKPNLCGPCNSSLTQPYDEAWHQLSTSLRDGVLAPGDFIDFEQVFPIETERNMRRVHLFLAKLFGSELYNWDYFDDTAVLADALAHDKACPHFYITVFPRRMLGGQVTLGFTALDLTFDMFDGSVVAGHMSYSTVSATWMMVYAAGGHLRRYRGALWHPRQPITKIIVRELEEPPADPKAPSPSNALWNSSLTQHQKTKGLP